MRYSVSIPYYQKHFHLENASFSLIEHDDAIVAMVYKVTTPEGSCFILKISEDPNHYRRELYFLKHFKDLLPIPQVIDVADPQEFIHGAILMEFLPGTLLKKSEITESLSYEIGSLLARIHREKAPGFGDLIRPETVDISPHKHFTYKFEEGLSECMSHFPLPFLKKCRAYYDAHQHLLDEVDGPCLVHRDFRLGNLLVDKGKVKGVIDWASARGGFAEEDFAVLNLEKWPHQVHS